MEVVEEEEGHAVLRLVGFDYAGPLFCRRQTGGLSRALEVAGGQKAKTAHVRCVAEGDAFCDGGGLGSLGLWTGTPSPLAPLGPPVSELPQAHVRDGHAVAERLRASELQELLQAVKAL